MSPQSVSLDRPVSESPGSASNAPTGAWVRHHGSAATGSVHYNAALPSRHALRGGPGATRPENEAPLCGQYHAPCPGGEAPPKKDTSDNMLSVDALKEPKSAREKKSTLHMIWSEAHKPLLALLLLSVAGNLVDSFFPQLLSSIPKQLSFIPQHLIPQTKLIAGAHTLLACGSVAAAVIMLTNLKSSFCKDVAMEAETTGDDTTQLRWEAYDRLGSVVIGAAAVGLGMQAIGLNLTSLLAVGGVGGLAIGLAGREIVENLFHGFLVMSTHPFTVGDEVQINYGGSHIWGIVTDIGWYRTLVRSFEREVYVVPNCAFSKSVVLNVSRKMQEFRISNRLELRVEDSGKVKTVVQDMRRIIRSHPRVIQRLHRRVFLDDVSTTSFSIFFSFYVDCKNYDSYMASKEDILLTFVDIIERNGAKLATPRQIVDIGLTDSRSSSPGMDGSASSAKDGSGAPTSDSFGAAFKDGFGQFVDGYAAPTPAAAAARSVDGLRSVDRAQDLGATQRRAMMN
eukprot:gene1677-33072_t